MEVACTKCGVVKPATEFYAEKRKSNGLMSACKRCFLDGQKRSRKENPERTRERDKLKNEKLAADPAHAEYKKRWRKANRDRGRQHWRRWHEANPVRSKTLSRQTEAKRRTLKKNLPAEDVEPLVVFKRDNGFCGICSLAVNPDDWHMDHIVPLAAGGSHVYENVQVSHPGCNLSKGSRLAA